MAAVPTWIAWTKPLEGEVVLNVDVDGSAITNPGVAGFGGLVRNSAGDFLFGFHGNVGWSHIAHADQVLALLHGIRL